ncbi:SusC/RagA family TonB-linked outer membrane protein [Flammeovirga agarivorans]|uniref:TonB-dependent receptor n=1 Tax=Flammeovirga agarivorans TaxID=2726742 RepID=A0A7X8SK80_9BACT|nr:TonB-dependent receptor [Flammeovirga agarivorans]NLR91754.1 TonB-dependent receptor [Flammeovirga agarivorans]
MKQLLLILITCLAVSAFAQDRTVKGTVYSDEENLPLPGVSVVIKDGDTSRGMITDMDGRFTIKVKESDILVFSFIGMETQEIAVNNRSEIEVRLGYDVEELDEVVVSSGYFDIKKGDVVGAVGTIGSDELEQTRSVNVENMIAGRVAGVIVSGNGQPGGGVGIQIRGTNSMQGGTQPLYVIDGIPMDPLTDAQGNAGSGDSQSALNFINPSDIESINILKDANATAIYGARGANGVVVITTKEADGGKSYDKLTATVEFGISEINNKIGVLDGPQFEEYMNQRVLNNFYKVITNPAREGMVFDGTQPLTLENFPEVAELPGRMPFPETTGVNTDWQDITYQQAITQNYNLAYRGGNKKGNMSLSFGLTDNQGVIINSDYTRATLNMNINRQTFDGKVTLNSRTNGSYGTGRATSAGNGEMFNEKGIVTNTLTFQPIYEVLNDGQSDDIYAPLNEGYLLSNPYTMATQVQDIKDAYTFNQAFTLSTNFTDNLSATAKGAVNVQSSYRNSYYPSSTSRGRRNNGEAARSSLLNTKLYGELNLRYQKSWGDHNLDFIGLGTIEKRTVQSEFQRALGFPTDATGYYTFENATDVLVPINNYFTTDLVSGLFRAAYNFRHKYYVDVNARIDASSKFAENNKSAIFPSAAVAWAISEENFLKSSEKINNLKLRASYGKTGNNAINAYQSMALMEPVRYNYDGSVAVGYIETNLANDNLTWETTDQFNVGLDIGLFRNRLTASADVYYKKTYDLLQKVNLPASNGFVSKIDNFGEVENRGIEVTMGYDIIKKKNFNWNVTGTFALNRNMLVSLNNNIDYQLGPSVGPDRVYPNIFMEGQPLGIFWGAETDGIYKDWDEANASGIVGAAPGEIKYVNHHVEYDADGNPLPNQQINFDDYVKIGDPNPDFVFSLSSAFKYKNWDVSFLITGQKGGDILWVESWPLVNMSKTTNVSEEAYNNSWKAPIDYNYETGEVVYNPSTGNIDNPEHPAPMTVTGQRAISSDRQIYDASYLRLKNVNLGYTFRFRSKRSMRLYASGHNLFTLTNYPGYDPEVTTYSQNPQRRGIDFGSYPGVKTYIMGIKFNY